MPAPGREVLSSRLTLALQLAPMLVWLVVVYFMIRVFLHQVLAAHALAAGGATGVFTRIVLLLLLIPFLLLPVVAFWSAGLRRVAMEGDTLIVGIGYGRTVSVPLTLVADVTEWRGPDVRTVRISFTEKTRAGRTIRFLAPTRLIVPRDVAHPVVLALRDMVASAKAPAKPALGED